jgi:Tol biopolymer transport system component/C-terminal processing protease CtpA/Prc
MKALATLAAVVLLGAQPEETVIRGMKHPALSPDGKRIAFDWHGDIWVAPVEGGRAERVTQDPADEEKPAWSPDGSAIVFSSDKSGNRDLFVVTLKTGAVRQLTFHSSDDDAPAWSPDGKWIAFQSNRDSNLDLPLNNGVWDLWRMPAEGGTATRVTRFRGENPAWSPDGKTIAYDRYSSGYGDGEHNIFVIASDGSGRPLEIASGLEDTRHPTFKGNTVFFSHEANGIQAAGTRNIWKTTARGGALIQVTGHRGDQVTWPSTVESSDTMVYVYDFNLYTIDLRHPKPQKLTITTDVTYDDGPVVQDFRTGFQSPSWSPSGSQAVFSCRGNLWISSIEGGNARQLTKGIDDDRDPSWSNDGRSVVYCSGPPGLPAQVLTVDVAMGTRTAVSPEAGPWRRPRFSPDGRRILVGRRDEESEHLWMIDVEHHSAAPWAASPDSGESLGTFSPDGTSVAYLSSKGGESEIVVAAADGTEARRFQKLRGSRRDLAWSPDGGLLAEVIQSPQNRSSIEILTPEGRKSRTVGTAAGSASWSPDSTMLLVESEGSKNGTRITIVDAAASSSPITLGVVASRRVRRQDEMMAVFSQVFGSYQENYYDPFYHGVDMPALRAKYAPLALASKTKVELYEFINDMIKELHSSHIHLTPALVPNPMVTGSLACDLERAGGETFIVRNVEPGGPADRAGIRNGDRIDGSRGRKFKPGADLDQMMTGPAAAGPVEVYLDVEGADGKQPAMLGPIPTIDRNALRELKYENTIARRKAVVKERSNGRLAYHHIRMMNASEVARLKAVLEGEASEAEGLLLDERDGVGGLAHRPICSLLDSTAAERLNRAPACMMRNRNGTTQLDLYGQGTSGGRASGKSWDKPVIMIQNSISRSDKEILPYTFRHLGIGYLVGMPTAGGVIGGSDWNMADGSKITVSYQGWFTMDGRNMEGWGVPPDYRVPETHEDLYAGRDAQLEKAIEVLLAQMDGRIAPPRKPGQEKKAENSSGK